MKNIYTSLDIGSDSIKVVVLELHKNKLNLLAASSVKSRGIKKGVITDTTEASLSVKEAINEVETMLGVKIKKVITNIPSYFAKFIYANAEIKINNEDNIITSDDVVQVLKECVKVNVPLNSELLTILPIDFSVDNNDFIKDPKGLLSRNLGSRVIIVTVPKKNIYSVVSLIENLGIEVIDISLNAIGDSFLFRDKETSSQIGAIINIGAETTEVSIFNKGIIVKNSIIGLGGKNIDNDVSYIYNVPIEQVVKLKEKFALAHKFNASLNDFYEINTLNEEIIKVNQFEVSEVVMSRLEEILNLAKKEISILTNKSMQYIIITGGTSHLKHFEYIANDVFGKIVNVGNIKIIGARHNKYSSAIGNVIYFITKLKLKGKNYSMFNEDDVEELSSVKRGLINNLGNDSMLGKVFNFFTSE